MNGKFWDLTVRRGHSPVVGDRAADKEERQFGSDKAERNVNSDIVDPFPLLQALTDEDPSQYKEVKASFHDEVMDIRDTGVNHEHASLQTPDAQDEGMLGDEHPFTTPLSIGMRGGR